MTSPSSLRHNRDFRRLWSAQSVSVFGSTVTREALPLLAILTLNATPAQIGLLASLTALPTLLFGLPAGVWIDSRRKRPLLIVSDLGRAALLVSIPVAAGLGVLTLAQTYAVAFLTGILTLVFRVADSSFLPVLVERDALVEANAKFGVSESVGEVGAPALTGTLIQLVSAPFTILIDAASYLVSASLLSTIRTEEPAPAAIEQSFRSRLMEGFRAIAHHPVLRSLACATGAFSLFGGAFGALYALYVVRTLELGPAVLGVLVSIGGVGALFGAMWTSGRRRSSSSGLVVRMSFLVFGLALLAVPLANGPVTLVVGVLAASQLVGDAALAVFLIHAVSLRQAVTPDRLLGRTNAGMEFLMTGMAPIGLLLGGVSGSLIGIRTTMWIAAGALVLVSGWLFLATLDPTDDPPDEASH